MDKLLSGEAWSLWDIEGQTILQHQFTYASAYFALQITTHSRGISSPVLISVAAALTRAGVSRFNRPIYGDSQL